MSTSTAEPIMCDCGHPATPSGCSTGYGVARDTGVPSCHACCYAQEKDDLRCAHRYTAYLAGDDKLPHTWTVVTWTGDLLGHVVAGSVTTRRIGRYVSTTYSHFRVRDIHGALWAGSSHGVGIYCRLRRMKGGK